jgi:hypothetical protein
MTYWLAFDIGCIECGEESSVIGVYATEAEAIEATEVAIEAQQRDWHGQHVMDIFAITIPAPPVADERTEG